MAQASKMGADVATRDARRAASSGHVCAKCGNAVSHGDLLMVQVVSMDDRGRAVKTKRPFHRGCYRAG
jgi:hypothetical protein